MKAKEKAFNKNDLVRSVVDFYSKSRDANGIPVRNLLATGISLEELTEVVKETVSAGLIEVVFEEVEQNPHVRRLPKKFKKPTIELLEKISIKSACLYPEEKVIKEQIDLSEYENSPYLLELWLGASQLEYRFFNLDILKKYQDDPRYAFRFGSRGGDIVAVDENMPEDEQIIVENMAVSYTENGERVLGVMLRYLCNLTPKYQRIWKENERQGECYVNPDSLMASYFGEFPKSMTMYEALLHEVEVINKITESEFGKKLFKNTFTDKKPVCFNILLIPTEREYRRFASSLDAILSENLNMDFFKSFEEIVPEIEEKELKTIGSLRLWLKTYWESEGDISDDIVKPFNVVRKERSAGAHPGLEDRYDQVYCQKQKELLFKAYSGIRVLRLLLQNLKAATDVTVPEYLNNNIVNP
jgi:hypothetical protein